MAVTKDNKNQNTTLGDVADVQNGYAFKSTSFSTSGIPVIKIKNMASGKINLEDASCYPNSDGLERYLLSKGDILVSMTGSHLSQMNSAVGKVTQYNLKESALLNQRVGKIYAKNGLCDNLFLFYLLIQPQVQIFWAKKAGGTANQANISPEIIKSYGFHLPSIKEQELIGKILSSYDELIENNEKRIKALEEMANLLYSDWFVKFKFPGCEKVKMVDSGTEYGKIPEGWDVKEIKNIIEIVSGYPFKGATFENSGKYKIVTIKNVHDGQFVLNFDSFINDLPNNLPNACVLNGGDILLSLTGNVGRVCVVYGKNHLLNQRVAKLNPQNVYAREFIYLLFRQKKFQKKLEAISNGAAQQNLSPIQLKDVKILIPCKDELERFHSIVEGYFNRWVYLLQQNENLRKMRDLLIPQLVTGKRNLID